MTIATFECEIVQKEFQLVGQSITANFPEGFPDAAIKASIDFHRRVDEVSNVVNKNVLISPYMCNEIVATYFVCAEVTEIKDIPDGMIGFKLPLMDYAKISCSNKTIGEAYSRLFNWMGENGYKSKSFDYASPVEIFYINEVVDEELVEVLMPIQL